MQWPETASDSVAAKNIETVKEIFLIDNFARSSPNEQKSSHIKKVKKASELKFQSRLSQDWNFQIEVFFSKSHFTKFWLELIFLQSSFILAGNKDLLFAVCFMNINWKLIILLR